MRLHKLSIRHCDLRAVLDESSNEDFYNSSSGSSVDFIVSELYVVNCFELVCVASLSDA